LSYRNSGSSFTIHDLPISERPRERLQKFGVEALSAQEILALILGVLGVCVNRWAMVLQVLAAPVMPFDTWALYFPSWQEIATTILPVAYGVILITLSYRYLPIFPQERELNPID